MKKRLSVLLATALLLAVLAGCQNVASNEAPPAPAASANAATQSAVPPITAATLPTTQPSIQYITPDEAKTIALQDAGLLETEVRDLEVELDRDDGTVHYDVDFEKGNADYDYDIDAVTGEILRAEKPAAAASSGTSGNNAKLLSKEEARDIALKHAGLKADQVRELEVELDRDAGKLHYDVDFEKDGYDYDYEIDAYTGKILQSHKERD